MMKNIQVFKSIPQDQYFITGIEMSQLCYCAYIFGELVGLLLINFDLFICTYMSKTRIIGRLRFHYDNDNEYENEIFVC